MLTDKTAGYINGLITGFTSGVSVIALVVLVIKFLL